MIGPKIYVAALLSACAMVAAAAEPTWQPPDSLLDLPQQSGLPDLLTFADGRRVRTPKEWQTRREELKAMLLYYQYGHLPTTASHVAVVQKRSEDHPSGLGHVEFLTLEIDRRESLRFRVCLYVPQQAGPRPVILREEGRLGHRRDVGMFLEHGYLFVEYARHDLDPDRDRVVGPAQAAYPNHDWATLSVWAWCGMRLLDYLETREDVDTTRIGITGHSRGGKMALLTAALDERIQLVVPHQSGSGGAGSYRVLSPGAETLAHNDKPHWYHERLRWFGEQEERLPFDQHFLKALVAPRALLCTESIDDEFANPLGTLATSVAVQQVYEFLGAGDRNAIHFRRGRHSTETEDWERILEFAQWQFFGHRPRHPSHYWQATFSLPAELSLPAVQRQLVPPPAADGDDWILPRAPAPTAFVRIAAPGNAPDRNHHGQGSYGHVARAFELSTEPVSHRAYAHFLNTVGGPVSGELYHARMREGPGAIRQVVTDAGYRYEVHPDEEATPVRHVSWLDAVRYCNWLHHGSPDGARAAAALAGGAYTLAADPSSMQRTDDARYYLPSEDEWYKAAYFDPTGDGRYLHFAAGVTDRPLIDRRQPDTVSPWGLKRFAGGVWEWTDSRVGQLHRAVRSGAWFLGNNKQAAGHFYVNPPLRHFQLGFRVARPATETSSNSTSPTAKETP